MAVLKLVAEDLADDALMEKRPSFEGRFLSMILSPPVASAKARAMKQGQEAPEKEAVKVAQA